MHINIRVLAVSSSFLVSMIASPVYAATTFGPYPKKIACDFYQTTTKKITNCKSKKVANAFCVVAMKSRLSKAVECNENGRIVCTRPCSSIKKSKPLDRCAYDPERRSGYEAQPANFCTK